MGSSSSSDEYNRWGDLAVEGLKGLGYALHQLDEASGKWLLIDAGSHFISETESRYAMVELELLAATVTYPQ